MAKAVFSSHSGSSDPSSDSSTFARVLLHKKEIKKKYELHPDILWMLHITTSHLFTPFSSNSKIQPLDRQGYQRWKVLFDSHKLIHPKRSRNRTIVIRSLIHSLLASDYPMSQVEVPLLECLCQFCTVYFRGTTIILDHSPTDLANGKRITTRVHHQTQRGQVLVDDVVRYMRSHVSIRAFCVVGVTLVDLYPGPKWNFTLGQASFTDGVAVCSFGRHFNSLDTTHSPTHSSLYRQTGNLWVLLRVLTHEIGHLFGITHCYYFQCAMNESASIDEAISQPLFLCPVCLRKLHKVLKFDVKERYSSLKIECYKLLDMVKSVVSKDGSREDVHRIISPFKTAIDWLEQCLTSFE